MPDTPDRTRSAEGVERVAEGWRRALDPEDNWAPNIPELIARAGREFTDVLGLHIEFLCDEKMSDDEARTEFEPLRICVRESLRDAVANEVPRLRSTLAHELGHAVLHDVMPKSRKNSGDGKVAYLAAFKVEEGEAWIFARAFLMPSWKVQQVSSALELSIKCRVSLEMAEIRFARASHLRRSRREPPSVRVALDRLKSTVVNRAEDTRVAAARERMTTWMRARHIEGQDPMRVRRSDDPGTGYEVHWKDHGKEPSPFGWFVKDGQVLAYYGRDRR